MLKTPIPSYILAVILTAVVGMKYSAGSGSGMESIDLILTTLDDTFVIHPLLMLPVLMVVAMILFKIPAISGIFLMSLVGALCAVFVQGADLGSVITSIHIGYVGNTGVEAVDSLLSRGGLSSMLGTASLIFCAISYGGSWRRPAPCGS